MISPATLRRVSAVSLTAAVALLFLRDDPATDAPTAETRSAADSESSSQPRATRRVTGQYHQAESIGSPSSLGSHISSQLVQEILSEPGESWITVNNLEFSDTTWHSSVFRYTTSYRIRAIVSRWGNELYLLGSDVQHTDVIERWTITPQLGAVDVTRPTHDTALGISQPWLAAPESFVTGGAFIAPQDRQDSPELVRRVVFRSQALGIVRALVIDPNGRFILLMASDGGIHQIACPPSEDSIASWGYTHVPLESATEVATALDYPQLGAADTFVCEQHIARGRIFAALDILEPINGGALLELTDGDNDGLIDTIVSFGSYGAWLDQLNIDPDYVSAYTYLEE